MQLVARIKPFDPKRGCIRRVYGHRFQTAEHKIFEAGNWIKISEAEAAELRSVRQDDYNPLSPLAFEIVTEDEAAEIIEREKVEGGDTGIIREVFERRLAEIEAKHAAQLQDVAAQAAQSAVAAYIAAQEAKATAAVPPAKIDQPMPPAEAEEGAAEAAAPIKSGSKASADKSEPVAAEKDDEPPAETPVGSGLGLRRRRRV